MLFIIIKLIGLLTKGVEFKLKEFNNMYAVDMYYKGKKYCLMFRKKSI